MKSAIHTIVWIGQTAVTFLALSSYGAMWRGAEEHGRKGWFIALIWSVGLVTILNLLHALDDQLETARKVFC